MSAAVMLFTRDLRVDDNPALTAATTAADHVVCLFVFDQAILSTRYAAPNRLAHLLAAVAELRGALRNLGGELVIRRGRVAPAVASIVEETGATGVHLSRDVSTFARRRYAALRALPAIEVIEHPGVTIVDPTALSTASGGRAYRVFTPYWRRWTGHPARQPQPVPRRLVPPPPAVTEQLGVGRIPRLWELTREATAPELEPAGEAAAHGAADAFFGRRSDVPARESPGSDATSRLSPHLHLGTISASRLASRVIPSDPAHQAFLRQLCWRDFCHQLLASIPDLVTRDINPRGDRWRSDPEGFAAWRQGRTGYPIVDAGMRQLLLEGWMHNRARMIAASFLTKHLRIDWRLGAWHFMDHLVDGDLAANFVQWQWVAGTGTDPRPNRMLNPVAQSRRHDPHGTYLRRHVPEVAGLGDEEIHAPWQAATTPARYPRPIVDHREARLRFLDERGA